MHLEILSNRYVSRLIADGVLSSEMLKCLVRDWCLLGIQTNSMFVGLYLRSGNIFVIVRCCGYIFLALYINL